MSRCCYCFVLNGEDSHELNSSRLPERTDRFDLTRSRREEKRREMGLDRRGGGECVALTLSALLSYHLI